LEVCVAVTKKLHDDTADPKESFYYAILASSMLFEQFSMNSGFRVYSNQSAMSGERINYLFEAVWSDLCPISDVDFKDTLRSWHEGIIAQNIHPFIAPSQHPTVLSFIHLIAQGIIDEHVYLPLTLLIA
jgi:hypothetical protein